MIACAYACASVCVCACAYAYELYGVQRNSILAESAIVEKSKSKTFHSRNYTKINKSILIKRCEPIDIVMIAKYISWYLIYKQIHAIVEKHKATLFKIVEIYTTLLFYSVFNCSQFVIVSNDPFFLPLRFLSLYRLLYY